MQKLKVYEEPDRMTFGIPLVLSLIPIGTFLVSLLSPVEFLPDSDGSIRITLLGIVTILSVLVTGVMYWFIQVKQKLSDYSFMFAMTLKHRLGDQDAVFNAVVDDLKDVRLSTIDHETARLRREEKETDPDYVKADQNYRRFKELVETYDLAESKQEDEESGTTRGLEASEVV